MANIQIPLTLSYLYVGSLARLIRDYSLVPSETAQGAVQVTLQKLEAKCPSLAEGIKPKYLTYPELIIRKGYVEMEERKAILAERIKAFSAYEEYWNGYDALPISSCAINNALEIIAALHHVPQAFPTPNGGVQIEFDIFDGRYLEYEICADGSIEKLYINAKGEESEDSFPMTDGVPSIMMKEIDDFYEGRI